MFNISQRKEGADSILSDPEESEDEVFGSPAGRRASAFPQPNVQNAPPASIPAPAPVAVNEPANPFAEISAPTPVRAPTPSSQPTVVSRPIAPPQPAPVPVQAPVSPPPPAPVRPATRSPQQIAVPAPLTGGANPFADFEAAAAAPTAPSPAPLPAPVAEPPADEERETRDKPTRSSYSRTTKSSGSSSGSGVNPIILFVLGAYAVLATAAAVYGLFFSSSGKLDSDHPLSTIPDNFGEFDPATRKKVSQYKFKVDGELPAAQHATLGERIAIGQLEIQPKKIEKGRLEILTEGVSGEKTKEWSSENALILTLFIKNTSSDLNIYPMDPAFTRKHTSGEKPITRLVVGKQTYAGGEIPWPPGNRIKRKLDVQQANDYVPLRPGESREYIVFTAAGNQIVEAVERAKDTMQWRVQVRRGPVEYRGKEIPVTAIIGVDFKASDVRERLAGGGKG